MVQSLNIIAIFDQGIVMKILFHVSANFWHHKSIVFMIFCNSLNIIYYMMEVYVLPELEPAWNGESNETRTLTIRLDELHLLERLVICKATTDIFNYRVLHGQRIRCWEFFYTKKTGWLVHIGRVDWFKFSFWIK